MSLYDIIGDISQKQVTKTETGDERIFGVMIGTVTRNYDQSMGCLLYTSATKLSRHASRNVKRSVRNARSRRIVTVRRGKMSAASWKTVD